MKRNSPIPSPMAVYLGLTPIIVAGCLWQWIAGVIYSAAPDDELNVLLFLATGLQHILLAAVWIAIGPWSIAWRVALAAGWAATIAVSMALKDVQTDFQFEIRAALFFCLVAGVVLGALGRLFGLQLRYQGRGTAESLGPRQFGTRDLVVCTVLIALIVWLGRQFISRLFSGWGNSDWPDWVLWASLIGIGAQCLTSLPILFLVFRPRFSLLAVVGYSAIVATTIAVEPWLMDRYKVILDFWDAVAHHAAAAIWTIAFAVVVRMSGYHFGKPPTETIAASDSGIRPISPVSEGSRKDCAVSPL